MLRRAPLFPTPMTPRLLLAGLLLAVLAPAASAQTRLFDQTFAVRDGQSLVLNVGSGAVRVETTASNEAQVVVEGRGDDLQGAFRRLRFTAAASGGTLTVRTRPERAANRDRAQFSYVVRIPRRFNVSIDTGSGAVRVGPLAGRLAIDTGSGAVVAGDVTGDVDIDTGSGAVSLGRVSGEVKVDTGSGAITVAEATRGSLEAGSGAVRVGIPRGANMELRASGSRVTLDDTLGFVGRRERDGASGRIGRGGNRLSIETGSGAISVTAR